MCLNQPLRETICLTLASIASRGKYYWSVRHALIVYSLIWLKYANDEAEQNEINRFASWLKAFKNSQHTFPPNQLSQSLLCISLHFIIIYIYYIYLNIYICIYICIYIYGLVALSYFINGSPAKGSKVLVKHVNASRILSLSHS